MSNLDAFTLINGQIYTPGLAIINAPQPCTPLGGDNLHISIDISGNGKIPLESNTDFGADTLFHDIRIFLTSFATERNLTISNGTVFDNDNDDEDPDEDGDVIVNPILSLEPTSTVKHINWLWPACFLSGSEDSWRGPWNISIHQSFRWEGEEYYTTFNLPINVTNEIPESQRRVKCEILENKWDGNGRNDTLPGQPFVGDDDQSEDGKEDQDENGDEGSGVRVRVPFAKMGWLQLALGLVVCGSTLV